MCTELKTIKENLKKEGFKLTYQVNKKRYSISKVGNPLERLCVYDEFLLDKGVNGVIDEYNKMVDSFREQEAFIEHINGKSVKELTLKEFEQITYKKIPHTAVDEAFEKFWNNLNRIEKRRIRNDYDGVAGYVYYKALEELIKS